MKETNVPLCLMHAREEVLLALGSESQEHADLHRQLANKYIRQAVRSIRHEPDGHDWSQLRPPH